MNPSDSSNFEANTVDTIHTNANEYMLETERLNRSSAEFEACIRIYIYTKTTWHKDIKKILQDLYTFSMSDYDCGKEIGEIMHTVYKYISARDDLAEILMKKYSYLEFKDFDTTNPDDIRLDKDIIALYDEFDHIGDLLRENSSIDVKYLTIPQLITDLLLLQLIVQQKHSTCCNRINSQRRNDSDAHFDED